MEKRIALFLFGLILSLGTAFGQTKINGTVVSQGDGEAIIGASVMVQGTTTGTVTDIDGKFHLISVSFIFLYYICDLLYLVSLFPLPEP